MTRQRLKVKVARLCTDAEPFKLVERDGYFHGRGTIDMKGKITATVVGLIRMKQSGYVPRGDIIVALTDPSLDGCMVRSAGLRPVGYRLLVTSYWEMRTTARPNNA